MSGLASLVRDEPVRVWLYGIAAAAIAVLVVYGILTPEESTVWLVLAAAIIGTPVATETLRQRVTPAGRHRAT